LNFSFSRYIADTQHVTGHVIGLRHNQRRLWDPRQRGKGDTLTASNPNENREGQGLSRRMFLGLLGMGGVAAVVGCETTPNDANRTISNLPDPIAPLAQKPGPVDGGFAAPAPTNPLPPANLPVEPPNTYGILPRSMWAKAGPDLKRVDPMAGTKLITFHHSGDPKPFTTTSFAETAQHLEYVREYHRSRKFQDIGYHFAIDRAGRVWQLRSLKYQGQHVRSNNEHNIGVVVLGNFELQALTTAQKEKIKVFGALLRKQYGIPLSRLLTHKEIVSTECPGDNMQPFMASIRKQRLI
jgi:hypothetical protein